MKPHILLIFLCCVAFAFGPLSAQPAAIKPNATDTSKLGLGDKITFRLAEDPYPNRTWITNMVGSAGEIDFPIGYGAVTRITVKALDRTLAEVKDELKKRLEDDYYQ